MKLYIAGPMRGYPCFNFPAFDQAAEYLVLQGHEAVSPAQMDRDEFGWAECPDTNVSDTFDVEDALRRDFLAILASDGILLLPGWEHSTGARAERFVAETTGKLVFLYDPIKAPHIEPATDGWSFAGTMPGGEVRVRNAETGGEKGSKPARFDLIPVGPLWTVAELYGRGAEKYEDRNWEKGYDWSLSFAALMRHAMLFWQGENNDPEMGVSHMASVVFHAFALMQFVEAHPDLDNRPVGAR